MGVNYWRNHMNLYGQAQLAKTLNDQKNIERNYWRIFRELEEAKKTIDRLETDNAELTEEVKALKVVKPAKKSAKKKADPVADEGPDYDHSRMLD